MEYPPSNSGKQDGRPEPKKVQRIVTGEIVRRKKPVGKRFVENFFGGTAKGAVIYIVSDVLLPYAKDAISDAVSGGIDRVLWGENRSSSRRSRYARGAAQTIYGHVRYDRPNEYGKASPRRDDPRVPSHRSRATHNFDELILPTRVEAEECIDRLTDLIQRYDFASVKDLYEMLGVTPEYTDDKWGWTDLRTAGVKYIPNPKGYLLDLPKPEPITP